MERFKKIAIAIFAYNEGNNIAELIDDLSTQTVLSEIKDIKVFFLCNGCIDNTVEVIKGELIKKPELKKVSTVNDFLEAGKSKTWNRFIQDNGQNSDITVFMDGDIRLKSENVLLDLVSDLSGSEAVACTSRPLKDLTELRKNPLLRIASRNISQEHKNGPICGQLYAVKSEYLKDFTLPIPCLVEDGFLSACIITGLFQHEPVADLVKASQTACHYFKTPLSFKEFFRHDVRLRLGCELNAALYSELWAEEERNNRILLLKDYSNSIGIENAIQQHLLHPERSALNFRFWHFFTVKKQNESILRYIIKSPVRFLYGLYRKAVNSRAKELFLKRIFQW